MNNFHDKTVVITGAATGISFAVAKQFASRGARLVLAARRLDRLEQAKQALRETGAEVEVVACDVTDREDVDRLVAFAERAFGKVAALVNNAGVSSARLGTLPSCWPERLKCA